jgi:hypothetical protein
MVLPAAAVLARDEAQNPPGVDLILEAPTIVIVKESISKIMEEFQGYNASAIS